MAPARTTPPSTSWIALREQIIDNFNFLLAPGRPDAKVNVILAEDEKGVWHARVIYSTRGRREERLCAAGRTDGEAMHALHQKTGRAVHHYYSANGARYLPAYDSDDDSDADDHDDCLEDDENADDDLDDVSVWNDGPLDESDDEETEPNTGSPVIIPVMHNKEMREARNRDLGPMKLSALEGNSSVAGGRVVASRSSPDDMIAPSRQAAPLSDTQQASQPQKTTFLKSNHAEARLDGKHSLQADVAHQGEAGWPKSGATPHEPVVAETDAVINTTVDQTIPPAPPPARRVVDARSQIPAQAAATTCYNARLIISMTTSKCPSKHYPVYQLITTLPRPSLHALLGAAVGYIRTIPTPGNAEGRTVPTLRARVKRVQMGSIMWDMGGYRADDMTIFFSSSEGEKGGGPSMPLFEVEVEDATGQPAIAPCPENEAYAGVTGS